MPTMTMTASVPNPMIFSILSLSTYSLRSQKLILEFIWFLRMSSAAV